MSFRKDTFQRCFRREERPLLNGFYQHKFWYLFPEPGFSQSLISIDISSWVNALKALIYQALFAPTKLQKYKYLFYAEKEVNFLKKQLRRNVVIFSAF